MKIYSPSRFDREAVWSFLSAFAERPEFVLGIFWWFTLVMHLWLRICRVIVERIQMFRIIIDRYARSSGPRRRRRRHGSSVKFRSSRKVLSEISWKVSHTGHRFLVIATAAILQANFMKIIEIKNLNIKNLHILNILSIWRAKKI